MIPVIYAVNLGEVLMLMCDERNGGDPRIKILSNFICVMTHSNNIILFIFYSSQPDFLRGHSF
jgi:hypothetical protein